MTTDSDEGGAALEVGDWRAARDGEVAVRVREKAFRPRTNGQARYAEAIRQSDITICSGPAGSGKTLVPVALAAEALKSGKAARLVLTRPLVACQGGGHGVGFLPGDLSEKVAPYVRPMLEALTKSFGPQELEKHMRAGVVEVVPLDYMRCLTFSGGWLVCDEMQNATFLSRS